MYPSHNFRLRYPALFESASGEKLPKQTKKIGLYTIILSIVEKNGLYDALIRSYGIENANMILDFSMYSILHHSCAADQYSSKMEDQLLFSSDLWSPSKLCGFFNKGITEEKTSLFRKMWAEKCRGQIAFMKACGVHPGDLEHIAEAENKRMASPEPSPFRQYPVHAVEDEPARKGPGRPKGSKNRIAKMKTEREIKVWKPYCRK